VSVQNAPNFCLPRLTSNLSAEHFYCQVRVQLQVQFQLGGGRKSQTRVSVNDTHKKRFLFLHLLCDLWIAWIWMVLLLWLLLWFKLPIVWATCFFVLFCQIWAVSRKLAFPFHLNEAAQMSCCCLFWAKMNCLFNTNDWAFKSHTHRSN